MKNYSLLCCEEGIKRMDTKKVIEDYSLSKIIAEKISEQIMTGELQPGEKVVESSYAEEYGTSRAPIREAIYMLTMEGLVERFPRKGAVVKGYTEEEIFDLLEIRMMLENLALTRVGKIGVEKEKLMNMEALISSMESIELDHHSYAQLNQKFHLEIIDMSKSEVVKNIYLRLSIPLLTLQRMSFIEEIHMKKSLNDHKKIYELLSKNKISEAIKLLTSHNDAVITRVRPRLEF
jgi:DNA-binding GntR family transcriptional regulator